LPPPPGIAAERARRGHDGAQRTVPADQVDDEGEDAQERGR
jgi:hypothetical protein